MTGPSGGDALATLVLLGRSLPNDRAHSTATEAALHTVGTAMLGA